MFVPSDSVTAGFYSQLSGIVQGNTATKDSPLESINQQSTAKLNEVIQDLPAEQQKALSQLYLFLVQVLFVQPLFCIHANCFPTC